MPGGVDTTRHGTSDPPDDVGMLECLELLEERDLPDGVDRNPVVGECNLDLLECHELPVGAEVATAEHGAVRPLEEEGENTFNLYIIIGN